MEGSEREADRPFALDIELVGLAHFRFHVIRYCFVERGFEVGKLIIDCVGAALLKRGVPSNLTNFSFTMRRMRSEQSTLWTPSLETFHRSGRSQGARGTTGSPLPFRCEA